MKNILIFNAGSSSLKFALFSLSKNPIKLLFGKCDRISHKKSQIVINNYEKVIYKKIPNFKKATQNILELLNTKNIHFDLIAHRVVHGGNIKKTSLINKKIIKIIQKNIQFAPLHNPQELEIINYCKKLKKPQYVMFDTSFYSNLPLISSTYPIPIELSKKLNLKKYGFHGISHKFVSQNLKGKTISCHLGNGASITAIKNNKPIDTSMGLTPLEGIMMATRAGDLDPGLIIFLEKKGYDVNKILNHKSGFKAFSNITDIREIIAHQKNPKIKLGLDIFIYKIIKYIGAYTAALNGLDNLVFTGGIGENIPQIRKRICDNLSFLGIKIDKTKNNKNSEIISLKNSKIKVFIKKTNEEELIAKEVYNII